MSIILDMWNIYTKYFNQANKADKEFEKISSRALILEQELRTSNKEKKRQFLLFSNRLYESNLMRR